MIPVMNLTDVSKTALVTLRSHAIESMRKNPVLIDPMAVFCLEQLSALTRDAGGDQILTRKLSRTLTLHIAQRARKYDALTNTFIIRHPGCIVISLGCGFDTRFWRIRHTQCTYMELDLPDVITLKKEILKDRLEYELMSCSVLDTAWIESLSARQNKPVLFLAEGLFMYLDKKDIIQLIRTLSENFKHSQLIMEVVTEKYTRGLWKKIVEGKMKRSLGLKAGSSYNFGIKNAREIESYGKGIKITGEWSFVEDPETPRIFKYLGISRKQWTVVAEINSGDH